MMAGFDLSAGEGLGPGINYGSMTTVIEVPGDAAPELAEILQHAGVQARKQQDRCKLRSEDPETRRYHWAKVANALEQAANQILIRNTKLP